MLLTYDQENTENFLGCEIFFLESNFVFFNQEKDS